MSSEEDGPASQHQRQATKTNLKNWWKVFKSKDKVVVTLKTTTTTTPQGVFGVNLQQSLVYASVAISQVGSDGKARIYGHVPVVVAKTGLFLKENGSTTQGIFRVSGSNKRIKELEQIFDSPPSYGKDLTWETYSVHDAASVFRRYLNVLPEPVIPYELYAAFRDALPSLDEGTELSHAQTDAATAQYKSLVGSLPPASQHIFYYVLDLLGVFARKAEQNLMPASNLATIFQPGLLRVKPGNSPLAAPEDPNAVKARIEADAKEHKKSQAVLEFLISHQASFELALPAHLQRPQKSKSLKPADAIPVSPATTSAPSLPEPSTSAAKLRTEDSKGANLARRGSDKSEDRRRLRRKKAEEKRLKEAGTVSIKRSNTLPLAGTGEDDQAKAPTTTIQRPLSPTSNAPKSPATAEKERQWWRRSSKALSTSPSQPTSLSKP